MRLNNLDKCNHWTDVTAPAQMKPNHLLVRNSANNLQLGSYAAKTHKAHLSMMNQGLLFAHLFCVSPPFSPLPPAFFLFSFFFFRNKVTKKYDSRDSLLYLTTWRMIV